MSERKRRQLERKRVRRNRKIAIVAALICVFILGLICGGRMVSASKPMLHTHKYYKEVKVHLGETLWDIANQNMTEEYASAKEYIKEVQDINSLSGDEILYGQRLLIPYYSIETQ